MSPRLLWLSVLPVLALQPALSRAAGQHLTIDNPPITETLREAGDLARKAKDELLRSFELLREAIPRYGLPYLDANGNIVVPRQPRRAAPRGIPIPPRRPLPA